MTSRGKMLSGLVPVPTQVPGYCLISWHQSKQSGLCGNCKHCEPGVLGVGAGVVILVIGQLDPGYNLHIIMVGVLQISSITRL